jgi:hypothetical protein
MSFDCWKGRRDSGEESGFAVMIPGFQRSTSSQQAGWLAEKLFSKLRYRRFWESVAPCELGELVQTNRFPGWLAAGKKNPTIGIACSAGI